jgi:hypothetical protein
MYFRFPLGSATPRPYNINFSYLDTDEDVYAQNNRLRDLEEQRRHRRESRQTSSSISAESKRGSYTSIPSVFTDSSASPSRPMSKRFSSGFFRSDSSSVSQSSDARSPSMSKRFSNRLSHVFDGLGGQHAASLARVEGTRREAVIHGDRS